MWSVDRQLEEVEGGGSFSRSELNDYTVAELRAVTPPAIKWGTLAHLGPVPGDAFDPMSDQEIAALADDEQDPTTW